MLKIKDNVDLKELEKFGFEYKEYYKLGGYYIKWLESEMIRIDVKSRKISWDYKPYEVNYILFFDKLYDLIKADLVEKIKE